MPLDGGKGRAMRRSGGARPRALKTGQGMPTGGGSCRTAPGRGRGRGRGGMLTPAAPSSP